MNPRAKMMQMNKKKVVTQNKKALINNQMINYKNRKTNKVKTRKMMKMKRMKKMRKTKNSKMMMSNLIIIRKCHTLKVMNTWVLFSV